MEFDSGPLVDAGFAAHRIDVGYMGDLPASLAAKSHLPVVAVAVEQPIGANEFLLAKPGISSISQLRGKPVAYTTGTAEQAFALRALKSAGLTQQDVHQVNVSLLQLGTVLESGAADASVVTVEQKVNYQQAHPARRSWPPRTPCSRPATPTCWRPSPRSATGRSSPPSSDLTKRLIKAENWAEVPPEPVGHRLLRQRRAPDPGGGEADPRRRRHGELRADQRIGAGGAAERGQPAGRGQRRCPRPSASPRCSARPRPAGTTPSSRRPRKMADIVARPSSAGAR